MGNKIKNLRPSKSSRYQQGYINTSTCKKLFEGLKYEKVIYRSSYERKFLVWLETCDHVKRWGSECIKIPYLSAIDGKMHTYYPDYFVEMDNGICYVIEIKPHNQTVKPTNDNYWANKEFAKNMSKWKAAKEFCDAKGYEFKVLTEKTIQNL